MSLKSAPIITPFYLMGDKNDFSTHQIIYASQLYGTFFAVAAKLNKHKTKGQLTTMDLTLVNYKGLLNIGLLKETEFKYDATTKSATLTLHLSAFKGVHGNGKALQIGCENTPLGPLVSMQVTRDLKTFMKHTDMTKHLLDDCFDEEFYERDGAKMRKKTRMDDSVGIQGGPNSVCKTSFVKFV